MGRLVPRGRVNGALLALVLAVAALQDASGRPPASAPWTAAGCALVMAGWLLSQRWSYAGTGIICVGAPVLVLAGASTSAELVVAVSAITAARRLPPVVGGALAAAVAVVYEASVVWRTGQWSFSQFLFNSMGVGALFAFTVTLRRLREEQERTRKALDELRVSREAQVEAARVAERVRLAREIHDVLGHTLSALAVQLEGARLLLETRPADPGAAEWVARAHGLARDGLEEARRAIGALRGDDLPGPDLLPRLVTEFERDSGADVRLAVEGEPVALAPEARLAIYRTAQEALTNVRRHARASHVDVRLVYQADGVELTVENDGGARQGSRTRGYGLTGMRERAELLGGRLEVGPTAQGFCVRLWVPSNTNEHPAVDTK